VFDLQLPVLVIPLGRRGQTISCETRSVSSKWVIVYDAAEVLNRGQGVIYVVTLMTSDIGTTIKLRCRGTVVMRDDALSMATISLEEHGFVRERAVRVG
jgi:hypothetical protein